MSKTKWYHKPIYALVALALVFSLGIMAVPMARTVEASPGALDMSNWADYAENPVFGQGVDSGPKAYYPTVVYDGTKYLMLYDQPASYATSEDGIRWTSGGEVTGLTNARHMVMLYDANGFGGGSYKYKMWYFDEGASVPNGVDSIRYAESNDGITWDNDQSVFGGNMVTSGDDNVDAPSRTWGPGTVLYNPEATNTDDNPLDYSYVMYYDGYNGITDDSTWDNTEALFLAYSEDGINWNRYTRNPVLKGGSLGEWDKGGVGYPTVMGLGDGSYIMWYSGGGGCNQGIGFATSPDRVQWTKGESNPIFHVGDITNPLGYRANRTYTPRVIDDGSGVLKMYYSAKSNTGSYAIGLALPAHPSQVWVDDDWTSQGDVYPFNTSLIWQYNAFDTIRDGINAVAEGGMVSVAAGTYDEQVVIDKSLTLQGAGDTTIIKPTQATANAFALFELESTSSTAKVAAPIVAHAIGSSVTVEDLKVDGDLINTIPTSGGSLDGVFYSGTGGAIDNVTVVNMSAEEASDSSKKMGNAIYIAGFAETETVEVKNCDVSNYFKGGITGNYGALTANFHNNTVTGRGLESSASQNGIQIAFGATGTIKDNTVTASSTSTKWSATGILVYQSSATVEGNNLSGCEEGIGFNGGWDSYGIPGPFTITIKGNIIDSSSAELGEGKAAKGISGFLGQNGSAEDDGDLILIIQDNQLTGGDSTDYGIKIGDMDGQGGSSKNADVDATITGNTISGFDEGIIFPQAADVGSTIAATITGNTIQNSTVDGILFGDTTEGVDFDVANITVNFNNIIGSTTYGVNNAGTGTLDATNNWWGDASGPEDTTGTNEVPPCTDNPTTEINIDGLGDQVSDNVDYCPWLGAEVAPSPTPPAPTPAPSGGPVGGEVYPVSKAGVLAPWIGLALVLLIGGGILVWRRPTTH